MFVCTDISTFFDTICEKKKDDVHNLNGYYH